MGDVVVAIVNFFNHGQDIYFVALRHHLQDIYFLALRHHLQE